MVVEVQREWECLAAAERELMSEGLAAAQLSWAAARLAAFVVEVLLAFPYFLMYEKDLPAPQASCPVENSRVENCILPLYN